MRNTRLVETKGSKMSKKSEKSLARYRAVCALPRVAAALAAYRAAENTLWPEFLKNSTPENWDIYCEKMFKNWADFCAIHRAAARGR